MKFIDLQAQYQVMRPEIDAAIQRVIDHGQFVLGPEVSAVEERLADMVSVPHCVTVNSGSTALQVALMALGVGPGDEVITSPFSFFATASSIMLVGATPVYVDIDPKTYTLDPSQLSAAITERTKAIIPVSLYGQCAEMDAINAIAEQHQLAVIEDAAQSLGATYKGRPSCSLSTIACTSFFPSKSLGCYGEGGACFTASDELAHRMRVIMNQGQEGRYNHTMLGMNARFPTLQAAVLLAKLNHFTDELAARRERAQWYASALAPHFDAPYVESHNESAYAQYTIQVDQRDAVREALAANNIPTAVHYPCLLCDQPIMQERFGEPADYPQARQAAARVISLPFYPYLSQEMIHCVAQYIATTLQVLSSEVPA